MTLHLTSCTSESDRRTPEQDELKAAGEWGRSILGLAEAAVDRSAFGDAWRTYECNSGFHNLTGHDKALIRVAFVAGWRARGLS